MIYAGVHTYANEAVLERQKSIITAYAAENALRIEEWLEFGEAERRKELNRPEKGDILLTAKLFRLGKDVREIMNALQELLERGVVVCSCEDGLCLDNEKSALDMPDCFKLAGEVARDVRARLTREALEMRRRAGKKLGRPAGSANKSYKLDEYAHELRGLLRKGDSISGISRRLDVDINTLRRYLKLHPELKPEKTK
ncbi:MAG: recombinase family protein [Alphaproteobacteria bacterium]